MGIGGVCACAEPPPPREGGVRAERHRPAREISRELESTATLPDGEFSRELGSTATLPDGERGKDLARLGALSAGASPSPREISLRGRPASSRENWSTRGARRARPTPTSSRVLGGVVAMATPPARFVMQMSLMRPLASPAAAGVYVNLCKRAAGVVSPPRMRRPPHAAPLPQPRARPEALDQSEASPARIHQWGARWAWPPLKGAEPGNGAKFDRNLGGTPQKIPPHPQILGSPPFPLPSMLAIILGEWRFWGEKPKFWGPPFNALRLFWGQRRFWGQKSPNFGVLPPFLCPFNAPHSFGGKFGGLKTPNFGV